MGGGGAGEFADLRGGEGLAKKRHAMIDRCTLIFREPFI